MESNAKVGWIPIKIGYTYNAKHMPERKELASRARKQEKKRVSQKGWCDADLFMSMMV